MYDVCNLRTYVCVCVCVCVQKQTNKGRTERIKDTHDPSFAKSFEVPYFFEEVQMLKFDMYQF